MNSPESRSRAFTSEEAAKYRELIVALLDPARIKNGVDREEAAAAIGNLILELVEAHKQIDACEKGWAEDTALASSESERKEIEQLRRFARYVFDKIDWPECLGDLDGMDLQHIATTCGLLTPTTVHASCATGEDDPCQCRDYYDPDYSVERTIAATGQWPEFTWREAMRVQPLTVKMEKDYLEFMPGPVQHRELMRFRLQRKGEGAYGETEVMLLHNEYTLAKADRCIWHGYSLHDEGAFSAILNDALYRRSGNVLAVG